MDSLPELGWCPFPAKPKNHGLLSDGHAIKTPSYCKKYFQKNRCGDFYASLQSNDNIQTTTCPNGFLIAHFSVAGKDVCLGGMIERTCSLVESEIRKVNKRNVVDESEVLAWFSNLREQQKAYDSMFDERIKKSLSPYHDIKRLIGSITSNAEKLAIHLNPGGKLGEAIEKGPDALRAIHTTAEMMSLFSEMLDALANPNLLRAGKLGRRSVYKSFDKLHHIFQALANTRRIRLMLKGNSYKEILAYDCFDLLPLVLIDNAIKYSYENQDVEITFSESAQRITVEISNFGAYIAPNEEGTIFHQFERGSNATTFAPGAGIGLYLARRIAEMHSATLSVTSTLLSGTVNDKPAANNVFSLNFKSIR